MKLRGTFDVGDTIITGSLYISSSAQTELTVVGNSLITGSLTISGAVGDDLIVFGMQRVHGTLIVSGTQTPDLTVIGGLVVTGSLIVSGAGTDTTTISNVLSIPNIITPSTGQNSISGLPLVNIAGLNLPINAGTYLVDTWIYGQSSNVAGAGFSISSSATVTTIDVVHSGLATGTTIVQSSRTTTNNASGATAVWAAANTEAWAHMTGTLVTSGTGRVFVRAANKAAAAVLTIRSGSYLSVTRLA